MNRAAKAVAAVRASEGAVTFTVSEMVLLREALRRLPPGTSITTDYADEVASADDKLTAALARAYDAATRSI